MNHLIEKIQSVDAKLVHIMGPDNTIADYVSRHLTSGDKAQVEQYLKRKVIPEDIIVAHMARAAHKQNQVGSASVFAAKVPPILSPASIKHWQQELHTGGSLSFENVIRLHHSILVPIARLLPERIFKKFSQRRQ